VREKGDGGGVGDCERCWHGPPVSHDCLLASKCQEAGRGRLLACEVGGMCT
jgi:hypothetical protein